MTEFAAPVLADLQEPPVPIVQIVQVPQVQTIENIVEIPEILSAQGTQTSESLGPAPVRRVRFADTVDIVEFEPPLPAEYVPPMRVTTPVVEAPPVVNLHPWPYVAPTPVETYEAPTPADEFRRAVERVIGAPVSASASWACAAKRAAEEGIAAQTALADHSAEAPVRVEEHAARPPVKKAKKARHKR